MVDHTVSKLIKWAQKHKFEIVAYGLAPNPWGFTFESHGLAGPALKKEMYQHLEALNPSQVRELKQWLKF
jgi:hypothetical protein